MAQSPEREPISQVPEGVEEIPETFEIPPDVERVTGIRKKPTDFTAKVTDSNGNNLTQSPATQTVTIQLPTTQDDLTQLAKGPKDNALTWFATFWLRMIKKAAHFGWKIISGGKKSNAS